MKTLIRIALIDDHRVVSRSLKAYLDSFPDLQVAGVAVNGEEALQQLAAWQAQVIICDLIMPGGIDGVETIRRIHSAHPQLRIIALTASVEEARMTAALRAGAAAYLRKDAEPEQLVEAVRAVASGRMYIDPSAAARLLQTRVEGDLLTAREKDVLRQLALGRSNKEIAHALSIAGETVKTHISSLLAKLGAENRSQAILEALRRGLVSLEEIT